jgi:rubredoxin
MSADPADVARERRAEAFLKGVEDGSVPLDGVMSPSTRGLVEAFGATGVDMTTWWAYTEADWVCPGCGRAKKDLVRLNQNGHLMCRLVEHHDHMQDLLLERFRHVSTSLERVVADEFAESFAKRSATMVSAYDNTIVCNDCNNADVLGKKASKAHPAFSFSPAELRRFIKAKPNTAHTICTETATAVWQEQADTFALRLRIVDRIAEIAATNTHWYQVGESCASPRLIEKHAKFLASLQDAPTYVLAHLVGPPRTNRPADPSSWRLKKYAATKNRPSPADIAHAAQVVAPGLWSVVSDDWSCPGCGRPKTQVVRPSSSNAWAFPIASKNLCSHELHRGGNVKLCGDCAWVVERLRSEIQARYGPENTRQAAFVSLDDIVTIVKPQPHARHNIDNDKAEKVVARIGDSLQRLADCSARP